MTVQRLTQHLAFGLPELLLGERSPAIGQADREEDERGRQAFAAKMLPTVVERGPPWRYLGDLVPLILGPVAHAVLADRLVPCAVETYLQQVRHGYDLRIPSVPSASPKSAALMLHLAAITAAMDDGLREPGLAADEAVQLVRDMVWRVYSKMGEVPWLLEKSRRGDRRARLNAQEGGPE